MGFAGVTGGRGGGRDLADRLATLVVGRRLPPLIGRYFAQGREASAEGAVALRAKWWI